MLQLGRGGKLPPVVPHVLEDLKTKFQWPSPCFWGQTFLSLQSLPITLQFDILRLTKA
jgi:hypothetical protein